MTYGQCTDWANTFFIYILAGSYDFCRVVTAGVLTFLASKMILHRPCYTVNIAQPLRSKAAIGLAEPFQFSFQFFLNALIGYVIGFGHTDMK